MDASANHQPIECRCGHTFCYACGKEWKTCSCPQFDGEEPADQQPERPGRARAWSQIPQASTAARDILTLAELTDALAEATRPPRRWVPRHLRHDEPVEPVEADNTDTPVQETRPQRRWVPRHLRPLEPVRLFRADSTDVSDEETAVDHRASAARRPGHVRPTNTGCDEHSWRRIGGGRTCQSCNTWMPNFLFRCRTCRHTSCRRCR